MANITVVSDLELDQLSVAGSPPIVEEDLTVDPAPMIDSPAVIETVWMRELAWIFSPVWIVRSFSALWLVPALVQVMVGGWWLSSPFRPNSIEAPVLVGRIWAAIVVLTIFTAWAVARWVLVDWDAMPKFRALSAGWVHGAASVVAVSSLPLLALAASTVPEFRVIVLVLLAPTAAVAALAVPRWLAAGEVEGAGAVAGLVSVVLLELTVGWFHLWSSGSWAAVCLLVEGLALATVSVTAVRALAPNPQEPEPVVSA